MKNSIVLLVIFAVISYLIGSLNWAILISKTKKTDIRTIGSGNPGTLNMGRNFGFKIGLLVFLLDIIKGIVPCLIAFLVFRNKGDFSSSIFAIKDLAIYLCGFCAVIGHIYPIYFKFHGGKGIASSIGVFIFSEFTYGYAWGLIVIMALVASCLFIYFTEFGSMGSFIAITPSAIGSFIRLNLTYYSAISNCLIYYIMTSLFIFLICFFTWFAHRDNIEKMLAGEEHATSIKQMFIKDKAKKLEKKNK